MLRLLLLTSFILPVGGCAQLTHRPVSNFGCPEGVPYYMGSHYLLVHTDGAGNLVSKLLFLPDRNKRMEAKPTAILASLESTMTLTNGILTKSKEVADSTAVPKAFLETAETALKALLNDGTDPSHNVHPAPSIFKVVANANGTITLVGKHSRHEILASVTTKKKEKK